tara:strand:- start:101 stop:811 length:711 start_codon:yes stop_codon:yes gene_type:complete
MKRGIVCTLGPASWNYIKELRDNGMSIARINGSFGYPYKGAILELKDLEVPVLVDIPGNRKKHRIAYVTDEELINFTNKYNLDYVGLSYVINAEEIREFKQKLNGERIKVVAKIENEEGYNNREEIIKEADIIMIDRGDLTTSIGFEKVPFAQMEIVMDCNRLNKEIIVATELMMSTLKEKSPNCADVSNIYFALYHGANYVTLSEETAIGKYPIESIASVNKIIKELEVQMDKHG